MGDKLDTYGSLKHHYGNVVGALLFNMPGGDSYDPIEYRILAIDAKSRFLQRMRADLEKPLEDVGNLTLGKLKEYVDFAESLDWTDPDNVRTLKTRYEELIAESEVLEFGSMGPAQAAELIKKGKRSGSKP